MNVTDISMDIFASTYQESEQQFTQDPLVLAVANKDLISMGAGEFYSLNDARVADHVNDTIRQHAETIRKYYSRKFFWKNLADGARSLSDYRSRLCYLLENRVHVCKDKDVGIYYKLPFFYDEDMTYDDFKRQYNTTDVPRVGRISTPNVKHQLTLTHVKTTVSRQQQRNVNRFWFTDNTYLYAIEVAGDNPLLDLFRQLIVNKVAIVFDTYYNVDRIDQMYFYKLFNFTLAKE